MFMIQSTTAAGHFFRLGRKWTAEGQLVNPKDFTDRQIEVLMKEPNLNVRPATEEEIAAAEPVADIPEDDAVIDELIRVIPTLPDDAFGKNGSPKIAAVREAADVEDDLITTALLNTALNRLLEGGYKPPVKA